MASFIGMGNPLLDISADVPLSLLEKYDVKLNNAILCEDKHKPLYKELVDEHKVEYIAGGATQNTIRVAQWMSQKAGTTAYIGSVGKDGNAETLRAAAVGDGVTVLYYEDSKAETGTCATLINNCERSLVANLAAANNYSIDHLKSEDVTKVWTAADFYYIAGFFLTVSPPSIIHMAEHAVKESKVVAMNLSAPFLCQFFKDPMEQCLPYVDYLFGNESEAEAFGKAQGYVDTTPEAVALMVATWEKKNGARGRVVVFTQGSESTIVVKDGKATLYPVPKIEKSEMVDSNGAGDAFVGGFMAMLIEGKDIKTCVDAGHYAAGVIIRTSGTVLPKTAPTFAA